MGITIRIDVEDELGVKQESFTLDADDPEDVEYVAHEVVSSLEHFCNEFHTRKITGYQIFTNFPNIAWPVYDYGESSVSENNIITGFKLLTTNQDYNIINIENEDVDDVRVGDELIIGVIFGDHVMFDSISNHKERVEKLLHQIEDVY